MLTTKKLYLLHFTILLLFSLIVLFPTFNLALTGDDYLGYWRITREVSSGRFNDYFRYFLTDYGPQDVFTLIIHKIVGFNSTYYYLLAFLMRFVAALSFYPLVIKLTRSKKSALVSALFFLITATGMEILDWSFNMPSYLGIAFMNLSLFFVLSLTEKNYLKYLFLTTLPFILSIVIQPLRMLMLPIITTALLLYLFISNKTTINKVKVALTILVVLVSFGLLFKLGKYGATSGVVGSNSNILSNTIKNIKENINISGTEIILYPVGQIGNTVFPTSAIPQEIRNISNTGKIILIIFLYLLFTVSLIGLKKYFNVKQYIFRLFLFLGILWTLLITLVFLPEAGIYIQITDFVGFFLGGYFLLMSLFLIINITSGPLRLGIFIAIAVIVASLLPPWIRNPNAIQPSFSRYLIVPASGMALFVGIIFATLNRNKMVILFTILMLLINFYGTIKYVNHLHVVRNKDLADKLRNSIKPNPQLGNTDAPVIYYFEADNPQILYHTIMFGFPFFMNYYKGEMENPWNIAYTENWSEVVDSYKDGSGLKRFGTLKIEPVKLENIFSYRLYQGNLIDTTENTRYKLLQINKTNSSL